MHTLEIYRKTLSGKWQKIYYQITCFYIFFGYILYHFAVYFFCKFPGCTFSILAVTGMYIFHCIIYLAYFSVIFKRVPFLLFFMVCIFHYVIFQGVNIPLYHFPGVGGANSIMSIVQYFIFCHFPVYEFFVTFHGVHFPFCCFP